MSATKSQTEASVSTKEKINATVDETEKKAHGRDSKATTKQKRWGGHIQRIQQIQRRRLRQKIKSSTVQQMKDWP